MLGCPVCEPSSLGERFWGEDRLGCVSGLWREKMSGLGVGSWKGDFGLRP